MKPSKEAIEAAETSYRDYWTKDPAVALWTDSVFSKALEAAYAIDVAPLEQRIAELEEQKKFWMGGVNSKREFN